MADNVRSTTDHGVLIVDINPGDDITDVAIRIDGEFLGALDRI
jgi:hypothetical protein